MQPNNEFNEAEIKDYFIQSSLVYLLNDNLKTNRKVLREELKDYLGKAVLVICDDFDYGDRLAGYGYTLGKNVRFIDFSLTTDGNKLLVNTKSMQLQHAYLPLEKGFKKGKLFCGLLIVTEYTRKDGSISYGFKLADNAAERYELQLRDLIFLLKASEYYLEGKLSSNVLVAPHWLYNSLDELIGDNLRLAKVRGLDIASKSLIIGGIKTVAETVRGKLKAQLRSAEPKKVKATRGFAKVS